MKYFKNISFLIIGLLLANIGFSQDCLISVKDLAKKLNDKNTVIVSTRKPADYKKVHIKNAVNVDVLSLCKEGPVEGLIKSPEELAGILAKAGIDDNKTIVIYDDGKNVFSGRLYWILKYLGHKDVKVLDGHLVAWRQGRKPLTKMPTSIKKGTLTPAVNAAISANKAEVKAAGSDANSIILDVRAATEFSEGNIPGSKNLEYKNFVNEDGTIKTKEQLQSIANSNGITAGKNIFLYCATSARAGVVYMALKDILGFPHVKVYDGAYNEWKAN